MISAIEMKIDATKMATATFPFLSSSSNATPGVTKIEEFVRKEHQQQSANRIQEIQADNSPFHSVYLLLWWGNVSGQQVQ